MRAAGGAAVLLQNIKHRGKSNPASPAGEGRPESRKLEMIERPSYIVPVRSGDAGGLGTAREIRRDETMMRARAAKRGKMPQPASVTTTTNEIGRSL
jgi:hypothetical protein